MEEKTPKVGRNGDNPLVLIITDREGRDGGLSAFLLLASRGEGRWCFKTKSGYCYRLMQSTAGLGISWLRGWNPAWPMERFDYCGICDGRFWGLMIRRERKRAYERKAERGARRSRMHAAFRSGSCDSAE